MLIKLKNPQENAARNNVIGMCYGLFLVSMVFCVFICLAHSWAVRALLLLPIVLFAFFTVKVFLRWRQLLQLRKRAYHVTAIDFQPAGVVLMAPCERFLPYAETDFHLRVCTDIVRSGKNSYPSISKIAFVFRFNEEEIEWEHLTRYEAVFPILDEGARFAHFSYDVRPLSERWNLPEYSAFVQEQIQNHLYYKAHLPFQKNRVILCWIMALVSIFFTFLLKNDAAALYGLPFLVFGIPCGWVPLFRFYRAKRKLDKYRK